MIKVYIFIQANDSPTAVMLMASTLINFSIHTMADIIALTFVNNKYDTCTTTQRLDLHTHTHMKQAAQSKTFSFRLSALHTAAIC